MYTDIILHLNFNLSKIHDKLIKEMLHAKLHARLDSRLESPVHIENAIPEIVPTKGLM